MAAYKSQVLYQAYRGRVRPRDHYALGWLPLWSRMATAHPMLTGAVNRMLATPSVAAMARKAAGIDPRRPLPLFTNLTFRDWFARHEAAAQHGGGRGVMLWVDTFTDHFSPLVGVAAVRVLEGAGFSVQIPAERQCCGLTWISTGQLGIARRLLERSAESVEGAVAQEIPVVGLEPSCTAVFRDEAAELIGRTVPMRTLAELLADVDDELLPRLDGVSALAQPHCHQHAVMGWQADADLLRRLGARVERLGGCCGLAGNFGVVQGHYDVSVAVAETALLPAIRARFPEEPGLAGVEDTWRSDHGEGGGTVLLADGFSCRTQVDQLTGRRAVHLAELLAHHK